MSGENPEPPSLIGDLEDLFENAPCGYLSTGKDGRIGRANATLAAWIGVGAESLVGRRFSDLLTIGGRLYHETHLAPLLRMQGSFSEVALDLARADGGRLPVLVNAVERRDAVGKPLFVRITVFDASERRRYERNLVAAKDAAERAAQAELAAAELREQFIAVLGHDLRNPLAAIAGGVALLRKRPNLERAREILDLMQGGVVRASALIDDVLDFARGRLGGGIGIVAAADAPIAPVIAQVVEEARSMAGDRPIEARIAIEEPVEADHGRIGQLVSNLLGNALTHGAPNQPIRLTARTAAGVFEVRVVNGGEPIPPAAMARLFQPFFRGAVRPSRQGLGLGLYIASEIAKAHGGRIVVDCAEGEIRFTFTMPCRRETASPGH
ncbi:MAG: HAMP domain-containing sensor histidine kinase [Caulobacteraceae bacterium]